jgi:CxxC-x17-CxxC domain-containing protein
MTVEQFQQRSCAECGDSFLYTEPEQRFRAEHGMAAPIRCFDCRSIKRSQRNADLLNSRGTSALGAHDQDGDRRRASRATQSNGKADRFPAICAACGQNTMVPFMPRGDRPVYCRACYNARRGR